jgi:hypothetical protein
MTNSKLKYMPAVIAAALLALCLPALAAAQNTDRWGRPVYQQNDRDYRRDGVRNSNYDQRALRDSIRRLSNLSERFDDDLDRALDHSRADGTRREDRINNQAKDFRRAANDLKNRFGDGRNMQRSRNEAARVLELGNTLGRIADRRLSDNRVAADWSQINQELRYIADAYGLRFNGNNGGYRGR